MKTVNLIKFGAYAWEYFGMREGFDVQVFPIDSPETVRVVRPSPASVYDRRPLSYMDIDEVKLEMIGIRDNQDTIRAGYSSRLNVLCIAQ